MTQNKSFSLPSLCQRKRKKLLSIAEQLLKAQNTMIAQQGSILHHTLNGEEKHIRMNHYPKGDRIDYQTGSQYFYHCHREDWDSEEHGHFHCFMRYHGVPKRIRPLSWPEEKTESPMTHLIAIAMNRHSQPIRLFTVNQWVASDLWYDAKHAGGFLKRYKMTRKNEPYWKVLDEWVEAMLHLFSPQIIWLQTLRDQLVFEKKRQNPEISLTRDRAFEELSNIEIDVSQQINWILKG